MFEVDNESMKFDIFLISCFVCTYLYPPDYLV